MSESKRILEETLHILKIGLPDFLAALVVASFLAVSMVLVGFVFGACS